LSDDGVIIVGFKSCWPVVGDDEINISSLSKVVDCFWIKRLVTALKAFDCCYSILLPLRTIEGGLIVGTLQAFIAAEE